MSIPVSQRRAARSTLVLLAVSLFLLLTAASAADAQPACTFTLSPTSGSFPMNGGNGVVNVTTGAACAWSSTSNADWVTITSTPDRIGTGQVTYTAAPNTGPALRATTLSIAGKTINVTQAACAYTVAPAAAPFTMNGGNGAVNVTTGTACVWTNTSNVPWVTISSAPDRVGTGQATFTVAPNTQALARMTPLLIAGKTVSVSQAACTYALGPANPSVGMNGGDASVTLTTGPGCAWTSATDTPWLTITSSPDRTGPGPVTYTVAPTAAALSRLGKLTIAGKPYGVSQAACAYTLPTAPAAFPPIGGTGSVDLATGVACPWTSVSSAPWLTITSSTDPRTGPGAVTYTVAPNTTGAVRSAKLTIGGRIHTVNQATCVYTLGRATFAAGVNGGTGSVAVTTGDGCPWTSASAASWVTITSASPQTGSGVVEYAIEGHATTAPRSAKLTIAAKTHTVNQAGCTYGLSAAGASFPPIGGAGTVDVATGNACQWANASSATWATITSNPARTGPGQVAYTVALNTAGAARTARLTIASKVHAITQAPCVYALGAATVPFGVNGGPGSVSVTASDGCPWTSTSNQPWVTISSPSPQTGPGAVTYDVMPNGTPLARTAILRIAGKPHTVTQPPCTYAPAATGAPFAPIGGSGSVALTTGNACPWTSTSNAAWVTITSGSPRTGSGDVTYTVDANTTSTARTAILTNGGKPYTITQTACAYTVTPAGTSYTVDGGSGSIGVTTGVACRWTAVSSATWLVVTAGADGTGSGTVGYTVQANTTPVARKATITIAGKPHTVSQAAAATIADLRVTLTAPGDLTTGKVVRPPITIRNSGGLPSGGADVGVFLSQTTAPGSGMEIRRGRVGPLNPGASVALDIDVSLPNDLAAGQYFMSVVADVDRVLTQAPGTHAAVSGPIRVGRGIDKFKDVSASVTFSPSATVVGLGAAADTIQACGLTGSLNLSGSSSVNNPVVNADGSVTASGNVTLTDPARPATLSGTFTVNVGANDRATLTFNFTTASVPPFTTTATATATGALRFSTGAGAAGAGGGLGFAFESDVNGFTGTLTGTGCAFTGSFKATVDQIFDLFFLNFLDAGTFGLAGGTPTVRFPVPFAMYEPVLSVVDKPNTLPSPGAVVFTGPPGSGLNGTPADPAGSVLSQADGFGVYQTPFVTAPAGPPDGTYTITYKGVRTFNTNIQASRRAVIPFPTVTLNAARQLTKVAWTYRDRQTGAAIATPSFIGLIGLLISTVNSAGGLDFCTSPFFERTTTAYTVLPASDCETGAPISWDDVFSVDFIYVDSLTFNAYAVSFEGPRIAFPQLVVGKVGPGTVTSAPAGIACGTDCEGNFARNSTVTLTATPAPGSIFLGWTGDACGGITTKTCTVSMFTDQFVGASFGTAPQVRFLNFTCVAPSCTPYTATLRSSVGAVHAWVSSTNVPSAYQTVLAASITGFSVVQGAPFNQTIFFMGSPFVLTPGHKYTIVLEVDEVTQQYSLLLFDTTASGTGLLRQTLKVSPAAPSLARPQARAPSAPREILLTH